MKFELDEAMAALSCTPAALNAMLSGLPRNWVENNEGPETWSPYDVIGNLVHCKRSDWIPRAKIILEHASYLGNARPGSHRADRQNVGRAVLDRGRAKAGLPSNSSRQEEMNQERQRLAVTRAACSDRQRENRGNEAACLWNS